jgi:uncharacterized membrane protein YoaT (DUF817 family)
MIFAAHLKPVPQTFRETNKHTHLFIRQSLEFLWQGIVSSVFAVVVLVSLALTSYMYNHGLGVPGLARYDLLLLICVLTQYIMWRTKLETTDELRVIGVFHLLGLALELFKTQHGRWSYPESSLFRIETVPLYSGFLYASVASCYCQAWRRMNLRLEHYPGSRWPTVLALAVYLNFFTSHILPDARWLIFAGVLIVYWRTRIHFRLRNLEHAMPLWLSFVLIGFFVYIAENIGTLMGGWLYPNQVAGWRWVDSGKWSSWSLLVVISFIVVAVLKDVKARTSSVLWKRGKSIVVELID